MAQSIRWRKQGNIEYSENNKTTLELSRGMIYRELYLRLTCTPDALIAENTLADLAKGDAWGVIKRIDIIANNTNVIRSISGEQLYHMQYYMYQNAPHIDASLGNGVADPAVDTSLIMPFWMPNCLRPMETALDASRLSSLKVEITWGDVSDVIANILAPAWITEPLVEVHSLESYGVKGAFSQWRTYVIEKDITATNPQFQVQLPVGDLYKGFLINTTDAGEDSSAILNNFKWKSGTNIYADIPAILLNQVGLSRNRVTRSFSEASIEAAGLYDKITRNDHNNLCGWYYFDHVTDGYLTETVDTLGFSELTLELDVTVGAGTTKLYILPITITPIRG